MFDGARLQIAAKAAKVQRVNAGPTAIALSFQPGAKPPSENERLTEKNGRWLLTGNFDDEDVRTQSAEELLAELAID